MLYLCFKVNVVLSFSIKSFHYLSKEYSYRVVSLLQDKDYSFIKYNFIGNTKLADLCELQNRKTYYLWILKK